MRKEYIVRAISEIIMELGYETINKGVGHAYDNTVWEEYGVKDNSNIPNIIAKDEESGKRFELRSRFGTIELDITTKYGLLVLNYSDYDGDNKRRNGNFVVSEVRTTYHNYKDGIEEIYYWIEEIDNRVKEYEKNDL